MGGEEAVLVWSRTSSDPLYATAGSSAGDIDTGLASFDIRSFDIGGVPQIRRRSRTGEMYSCRETDTGMGFSGSEVGAEGGQGSHCLAHAKLPSWLFQSDKALDAAQRWSTWQVPGVCLCLCLCLCRYLCLCLCLCL